MNFSKKNHELQKNNIKVVSKTIITLLIALLISIPSFAQQGINYKAVIKDSNGNLVVNNPNVTMQFEILKGASLVSVYGELHTTSTNVNGIAIVNIGKGALLTGSPTFSTINWGSDEHFLNVKINIGSGLVDLGTTQFMAVPYAITSADAITKIDDLSDAKSDNDGTQDGSSIFIGVDAGLNDDGTDNKNVGIGKDVLRQNNAGYSNIAIGQAALRANTTGFSNIAMGQGALVYNNTGKNNIAIGESALLFNNEGFNNTATGVGALYQNKASHNTAYGYAAMYLNDTGSQNTAIGLVALYSNSIGNNNTAIGHTSLYNSKGESNTAIGQGALYSNISGDSNTAIGTSAGYSNTTGTNNVFIGSDTGNFLNRTLSNKLYIDNSSTSNPLIYGEFDTNLVRINGVLDVTGEIRTPATGNSNMAPIAYGSVNFTGNIAGGTGNFTVSLASEIYTITVTGKTLTRANTSVSVIANSASFRIPNTTFNNGKLEVQLYSSAFTKSTSDFQFIIYQE